MNGLEKLWTDYISQRDYQIGKDSHYKQVQPRLTLFSIRSGTNSPKREKEPLMITATNWVSYTVSAKSTISSLAFVWAHILCST